MARCSVGADGVSRSLAEFREAVVLSLIAHGTSGAGPRVLADLSRHVVRCAREIVRDGWRRGWSPDQCGAALVVSVGQGLAAEDVAAMPSRSVH